MSEGAQVRAPVVLAVCAFGRGGAERPSLAVGWGEAEDGFAWSMGAGSRVVLACAAGPGWAGPGWEGEVILEIALNPFVVAGRLAAQRLVVVANGVEIGRDCLVGEGTVAYRVPGRALGDGGALVVELRHPDACSPARLGVSGDGRVLGFMVRAMRVVFARLAPPVAVTALPPLQGLRAPEAIAAVAGMKPGELVLRFESLGHNCEFGVMQRQAGVEPLGLLRFAGITLDGLLAGLRRGFEGIGEAISVTEEPSDGGGMEFIVRDERYSVGLHSFVMVGDTNAEAVRHGFGRRLVFMRDHFLSHMQKGARIFVFQRPGQITRSQAFALLTLLRGYGPNALLYVDQSDGLPPGAVEQLEHGLFHGTLAAMAPARELGRLDYPAWLSLCANARRLWGPQAG